MEGNRSKLSVPDLLSLDGANYFIQEIALEGPEAWVKAKMQAEK